MNCFFRSRPILHIIVALLVGASDCSQAVSDDDECLLSEDQRKQIEKSIFPLSTNDLGAVISDGLIVACHDSFLRQIENNLGNRVQVKVQEHLTVDQRSSQIVFVAETPSLALLKLLEPFQAPALELGDANLLAAGQILPVARLQNQRVYWNNASVLSLTLSESAQVVAAELDLGDLNRFSKLFVFDVEGRLLGVKGTSMATCDAMRRVLKGDVLGISVRQVDGNKSFECTVSVADHMNRLKTLKLAVWTSEENGTAPTEASATEIANAIELNFMPVKLNWRCEIDQNRFPLNGNVWGQVVEQGIPIGGVFLLKSKSLSVPTKQKTGQPSVAGPQVSTTTLKSTNLEPSYSEKHKAEILSRFQGADQVLRPLPELVAANRKPMLSDSALGNGATEIEIAPFKIDLGEVPVQALSSPTGSHLFVIKSNEALVYKYETSNFRLEEKWEVPSPPVAMQLGNESLAVACPDAKAVAFIDCKSGEFKVVKHGITSIDVDRPVAFSGTTPDGSVLSIWEPPKDSEKRWRKLFLLKKDSPPFLAATTPATRYLIPSDLSFVLFQQIDVSPQMLCLFDLATGRAEIIRDSQHFLRSRIFDRHLSFGYAMVTHDKASVLLPASRGFNQPKRQDEEWPFNHTTYLLTADLSAVVRELPGCVLAEIPQQNLLISVGIVTEKSSPSKLEILYIDRHSGQVTRRIRVKNYLYDHDYAGSYETDTMPNISYVPGREAIVICERKPHRKFLTIFPCGPVAKSPSSNENKSLASSAVRDILRLDKQPPELIKVGQELRYSPKLLVPNTERIQFRLAKRIPKMEINPSTGELYFTAEQANLGNHDIRIDVEIAGRNYIFHQWILKIEK